MRRKNIGNFPLMEVVLPELFPCMKDKATSPLKRAAACISTSSGNKLAVNEGSALEASVEYTSCIVDPFR
jgi:hypothetical protein